MAERNSPREPVSRRPELPHDFEIAANLAYYGGRFENSRIGPISGPIYKYDIRSAYPASMLQLPCPIHTKWKHRPRARSLPEDCFYVAKVSYSHPDGLWCGLPFRRKGVLFWPFQGTGWYWSPEIEAASRCLGADIIPIECWVAECNCDCTSFGWVRELYDRRRELGSKTRGYPLKLGLNSLYGKLAQRRTGSGPYHDAVAAGLITSITRARLIEAVGQDPGAVFMLATDAACSTRPLTLNIGDSLGQWEEEVWPDLFVVKPGVYWSPSKHACAELSVKSRGTPRSIIENAIPQFHAQFNEWLTLMRNPEISRLLLSERKIPAVPVTVRVFHGMTRALQLNKPWLAGKWEDVPRHESFEWNSKRDAYRITLLDDGGIITYPRALAILDESEGYKPADFDNVIAIRNENGNIDEVDGNLMLEAQPDYTPFLPEE